MKKFFGFVFRSVLSLALIGLAAFCGAWFEARHPLIGDPGSGYAGPVDDGYRTDPEPVPDASTPSGPALPGGKYWVVQVVTADGPLAPDRILIHEGSEATVIEIPEAFRDLFKDVKEGETVPLPPSWQYWDGNYRIAGTDRAQLQVAGWLPEQFPVPSRLGLRAKFVFAR